MLPPHQNVVHAGEKDISLVWKNAQLAKLNAIILENSVITEISANHHHMENLGTFEI